VTAVLLLAIRLYWAVWPDRWKRGCLYRETCSRHVYRVAEEHGLAAGLRALRTRFRTCRPGYGVVTAYGQAWLALADGSMLRADEAAAWIVGAHGGPESTGAPAGVEG
jgi:putative component of membrane protein insertase Oxa1/YidC/SpoIIIJ protein YidD